MPARLKNNSLTIQTSSPVPATPVAGEVVVYAKTDKKLYSKDDSGIETLMSSDLTLAESGGSQTLTNLNTIKVPRGTLLDQGSGVAQLGLMANPAFRNVWMYRAAAATIDGVGVAVPTMTAVTVSNDVDSTYINSNTGVTAGTLAGLISTTFNLVRRQHNPIIEMIVRTGADVSAQRLWLGLTSGAITNVDTIVAGTSVCAFRFSTAVDSGWVGVCNNGSSQSNTSLIATVAANTRYLLRIRIDNSNGVAYFSVNNGSEVALNTNLPTAATELGCMIRNINITTVAKDLKISRVVCSYD